MKYCYLALGYPAGYLEKDRNIIYCIDTRTGTVEAESDIFKAWFGLKEFTLAEEVTDQTVRFLKTSGLVLEEDTLLSLFSRIFDYVPYRQGWGDIRKNKYALVLGSNVYYPNKLQMDIWRNADGKNTFLQILRKTASEHKILSPESKINFMMQLEGLLSCRLLYIK